ncbi:carboxylesterase family protein [Amycolatopsis rhabdoformis]|uniref:Carboxylic ester hydrolase n=1 Tax=Amycolatopsis rhabdoformis TaxID=1448059 RepID=A0ABZ1I0Q9_9PSEU|nr:carboxylesterase family protein [Amycolatopsis rhabdoformis]WSE27377.1 carboxylesterase family protein [Amycolatopsis rhabdoformis]
MRRSGIVAAVAALLVLSTTQASAATPDAPLTVHVDSGTLHGNENETTRHFLGVPYAKPPVGALRWASPQPAAHWSGVREATQRGSSCPQTAAGPGQPASADEDCLFVNVTTPRHVAPGAKLPVMVWWHGGGYTSGAGDGYNADRLAAQGNVIVVTLNYRLGIFGYYGLPGLRGSGTFGLQDQIAGLRWAKRNATAFGGDADNLTIFGESAGGMSVCAMLTSPQARGLVDKAIISSGSCKLDWPAGALFPGVPADRPYLSLHQDQADGVETAHSNGCTGNELACMRAKPAADLVPLNQSFSDHLSYGTPVLPLDPSTALRHRQFLRVPVISGGNRDEQRAFAGGAAMADPTLITDQTYPTLLRNAFGPDADRVAAHYPISRYGSALLAWSTATTDAAWACPTATGDRELAAHTTVYPYEFADPSAPNVNGITIPGFSPGAAHASDLPSLFDLGGTNLLRTPGQQSLAATMIAYWTTFARTGNPNHAGAPFWPTTSGTRQLQLAPGHIQEANVAAQHQCGFWVTVH